VKQKMNGFQMRYLLKGLGYKGLGNKGAANENLKNGLIEYQPVNLWQEWSWSNLIELPVLL